MTQYRCSALSMTSIERDILGKIDIEDLINIFANSNCRKMTFLYYFLSEEMSFYLISLLRGPSLYKKNPCSVP